MDNHILTCYDKDLLKVKHSIVKMASLVHEVITISSQVFDIKNTELADRTKAIDLRINKLDNEVEDLAIEIIALRSPKASDLRETIAALKIAVILERMGDLAKNVARKVVAVDLKIKSAILQDIKEMLNIVGAMQSQLIDAYESYSLAKLDFIFQGEQKVDDLYKKLRIAIEEEMKSSPANTSELITIVFALKNFERIADYITKIAFIFKYVITGDNKNDE